MKRPKIVCGWGSTPDPTGGAYDTLPDLLVGWGGEISHPHSSPLDTFFDRCSWTFVGTGRKDGHPQFLKRGCALVELHLKSVWIERQMSQWDVCHLFIHIHAVVLFCWTDLVLRLLPKIVRDFRQIRSPAIFRKFGQVGSFQNVYKIFKSCNIMNLLLWICNTFLKPCCKKNP